MELFLFACAHNSLYVNFVKVFIYLIYKARTIDLKEMGSCLSCDDDNNSQYRRVVYVPTNPSYQQGQYLPPSCPPAPAYYYQSPAVYDYNQRSLGNSYGQTQNFVGGMLGGMLLGDALDMDMF